jgi:alcohol-forming fatty acyl-CoA reductase
LEKLKPHLLGKWPNTYTFTKALAEDFIKTHSEGLPIVIFRPGIVISTSREPMAGWIDNKSGPSGIVLSLYFYR